MKNSIIIPNFKTVEYSVYTEIDGFIGMANEQQLDDIKLQVILQERDDVYVIFNDGEKDIKITLNKKGEFSSYPIGFLDFTQRAFAAIFNARKYKKKELTQTQFENHLVNYQNHINKYFKK